MKTVTQSPFVRKVIRLSEDLRLAGEGAPLEPPFYGIGVRGALLHTRGGLKVDACARVALRHTLIPAKYAGGRTVVEISGKGCEGYSSGDGLLTATAPGKIAGEATSEEPTCEDAMRADRAPEDDDSYLYTFTTRVGRSFQRKDETGKGEPT